MIFFATGASAPKEEYLSKIWEKSVSKDVLEVVPHFYMQSGINYQRIGLIEKCMKKVFSFLMNRKQGKESWSGKGENTSSKSIDVLSKKFIIPLVECVEKMK